MYVEGEISRILNVHAFIIQAFIILTDSIISLLCCA